jgi:hypothetical protein
MKTWYAGSSRSTGRIAKAGAVAVRVGVRLRDNIKLTRLTAIKRPAVIPLRRSIERNAGIERFGR